MNVSLRALVVPAGPTPPSRSRCTEPDAVQSTRSLPLTLGSKREMAGLPRLRCVKTSQYQQKCRSIPIEVVNAPVNSRSACSLVARFTRVAAVAESGQSDHGPTVGARPLNQPGRDHGLDERPTLGSREPRNRLQSREAPVQLTPEHPSRVLYESCRISGNYFLRSISVLRPASDGACGALAILR